MSENDNLNTQTTDDSNRKDSAIPKIDRLGVFKIEKTLSSGGGGTVYLAFDESMKRHVALKVLHPSLSIAPKAQARFAREAWIAGQLEHQNIIKVYSRGKEKGLNYIALEFAENGSLSDYIKGLRIESKKSKGASVTSNREHIKTIVNKFIDLAEALEDIHSKGFIHRDIKPHNILLAGVDKKFKLTDFGIAHAADMTKVTKAGDFMGTVHYMSPEQITAHRTTVDKRTDIYSLGVTLYETLTLALPFDGDSEEKLIGEIISGHFIPARKRLQSIPKDIETILIKATHHDASRRYQSARDFADDLRRYLELKAIVARRDSIFYKAGKTLSLRRRNNQIVAAVFVIIVAGGITLSKIQQDKYDSEKILTSLKRAVETKTSPFYFEPEWPRLSKILYKNMFVNTIDSLKIWYFKASTTVLVDYRQYSTRDKASLTPFLLGIQIFEDDEQFDDFYVAQSSIMDFAIDNWPFVPIGHEEVTYNGVDRGGIAHTYLLKDAPVSISGSCRGYLRTIISHFLGSKLYLNYTTANGSDWKSMIENWVNSQYKVSATGDSIFEVKLGNAFGGPLSGQNDIDMRSIRILDTLSLRASPPAFVDTIIDTLSFFIYDEFPKDFPRQINTSENISWIKDSVSFDRVLLVRDRNGKFVTHFFSEFPESLEVPIAGDFQIINSGSGAEILTGKLRLSSQLFFQFDLAFGDSIIQLYGNSGKNNEWEYISTEQDAIISEATFDSLVQMGTINATMRINPSIEVARQFGDIYEFWGGTLTFDITLQAIDSTKTN